jgi:7-alpha-hydroxysteroid dehydrogenase
MAADVPLSPKCKARTWSSETSRRLLPFRPTTEDERPQMILDRFRLDDKVAVITGGGRGLGAAIALAFAEVGADVVIASRTQSELDAVAEQIRATGRRAHTVAADLAHPEVTAQLAGQAVEAFGRLDIVVNNVGGTMPNTLLTTSIKDLKDAFTFNVVTAHALTVAAVPLMLEHSGGGSVINISSTMGRLAGRGFAAYGTAKAALSHYTRLAALDLCPRIRVNAIAPGSILTSALDVVASNDELRKPMEKVTPMRRLGDPVDIAAAAVYLASPAGDFLTGKTLEVDGGLTFPNLDIPVPDL